MLIGTYDYWGYYNVCFLGDEVKDPARNIPRALLLSILLVAGLYILMNLSILAVACIAVVVIAGITNFIVDPYAMHGVVELVNVNQVKQESGTHARLYRANVISRRAPGVLALGTSRSARGISMDHPGWKGVPAERYNASLLGANIYEIERYFEHAHRTHVLGLYWHFVDVVWVIVFTVVYVIGR
jgi:hypothetical protein